MTDPHTVILEMTRIEAGHLADLVAQFSALLQDREASVGGAPSDPALARLVPDAYPDDAEAAREFRDLTETALLHRRAEDAATVLASIGVDTTKDASAADARTAHVVRLDPEQLNAWLRTLAALRLVLAIRLGIDDEDDHDEDDPRFGVYDWLGYRLEGLVHAAEA
ncbi:DUF2017 family protein [Microbacterium sp.]|uniref:DUF2017 family protein n=1 Tax=Microbacterium sp. TaxID=51671 RepID=UPI00092C242F|nr:DUF2017 family protein [Microbacterium sp.]MBN9184287.1 DUF2017 family protein [Microbacterium sp.]MBN9191461.1 DUF2017 family protein [Microbacterium sp.]OJU65873.1 MAG: hypothetical protein BGO04_08190 [Microbacterium sp. 70-38]